MFEKELVVKNKSGLHARPASDLTVLCQKFDSDIKLITSKITVNPKSIISILAGGFMQGTKFTLQVEGPDENMAGEEIVKYINGLEE